MKLFANTAELNNKPEVLKVLSLTKTMPAGDNVFTVHVDDHLTGNAKRGAALRELHNLTGRPVLDMIAGMAIGY